MNCTVTQPWPCEREVAGGTTPLGSVLCARHLAGVLAPPRPPDIDRAALRKYWRASTGSEVVQKSTIIAPDLEPRHQPLGVIRMPAGRPGCGFRIIGVDDPAMPRTARSAMLKATRNGWNVRATAVGTEHVMVKCWRGDARLALTWLEGGFHTAWLLQAGDLQPLGYRAALALL